MCARHPVRGEAFASQVDEPGIEAGGASLRDQAAASSHHDVEIAGSQTERQVTQGAADDMTFSIAHRRAQGPCGRCRQERSERRFHILGVWSPARDHERLQCSGPAAASCVTDERTIKFHFKKWP